MQTAMPLACFLSVIRPPGVQFEDALLQVAPVDKIKCPFVRDAHDVEFQLYTRHNPIVPALLRVDDDETLFASNFDVHAPTVLYFHGFMETANESSALLVREAYTHRGDTNVIVAGAPRLEAGPWYFTAADNTWYIGQLAARLIDYLHSRGLDLSKTHLVGHSLGAQSAAVAGAHLKSGRVSRITGLDPALPLFAHRPLPQRLDPTDADFVDVIHTDAGIFGFNQQVGHADFYPNGGVSPQPGCELEVVLKEQLLFNKFFCSHWRSFTFYADSVLKPDSFPAAECASRRHYARGYCTGGTSFGSTIYVFCSHWRSFMFYAESVLKPDSFPAAECASWRHYARGYCTERTTFMGFGADRDNDAKSLGFYTFYLKPNKVKKSQNLEYNLVKFFQYLHSIAEGDDREKYTDTKRRMTRKLFDKNIETDKVLNRRKMDIGKQAKVRKANVEKYTAADEPYIPLSNPTLHNSKYIVSSLKTNQEPEPSIKHNLNEPINAGTFENKHKTTTINDNINKPLDKTHNPAKIHKLNDNIAEIDTTHITAEETYNRATGVDNTNNPIAKPTVLQPLEEPESSEPHTTKSHVVKRQKRFLQLFKRSETVENDNLLFRMLEFLLKHRKNIVPVFTVMREVNTLVKSANGELNHAIKERNNFIGANPPTPVPVSYSLELANENRAVAFVKKLLGLNVKGDRLTINGSGK